MTKRGPSQSKPEPGAGAELEAGEGSGLAQGPDAGEPSFEACAERLEKIVVDLEDGDLPLERSLELFEEGIRIARAAQARLDRAERRVQELLDVDGEGRPVTRDLDL